MHLGAKFAYVLASAYFISCSPALSFHGKAITVSPTAESEIVFAYDEDDLEDPSFSYVVSPFGFLEDVVSVLSDNSEKTKNVRGRFLVLLQRSEKSTIIEISRKDDGQWVSEPAIEGDTAFGPELVTDVLCRRILRIECSLSGNSRAQRVLFDAIPLDANAPAPLVSVGSFPLTPTPDINIDRASGTNRRSPSPAREYRSVEMGDDIEYDDQSFVGNISDAAAFLARRMADVERFDNEGEVEQDTPELRRPDSVPPFERESSVQERGVLRIAEGYDPRLRYITIHCTGGLLSESAIRRFAGRKNKAHGYLNPDGSYIPLWSIKRIPNDVYATKTETCLRTAAMGTMFNIELNYDCHWRPQLSSDPTEIQYTKLAEIIAWALANIGDLAIVSHTYVDMGLRDGHSDPQGKNGFDWKKLYSKLESHGIDVAKVRKVDPDWASGYPISRTDRAHNFPPTINKPIPAGPDMCRRHAAD